MSDEEATNELITILDARGWHWTLATLANELHGQLNVGGTLKLRAESWNELFNALEGAAEAACSLGEQ